MSYELYTDGTYSEHINIAGIGGYILQGAFIIKEFAEEILEQKNKVYHENIAVIKGMELALSLKIEDLVIYSDYNYYEKYLNDDSVLELFKTSQSHAHNELIKKIYDLIKNFKSCLFKYIPREKNTKAHNLAGKVYRGATKQPCITNKKSSFLQSLDNFENVKMIVQPVNQKFCPDNAYIKFENFKLNKEPQIVIKFLTDNEKVVVYFEDLISGENKFEILSRYPTKKEIVQTIGKLTQGIPSDTKANYYRDDQSKFLTIILFQ